MSAPSIPKAQILSGLFCARSHAVTHLVTDVTHMYLLKRGYSYYFNRRVRTNILRIALHTKDKSIARERVSHVYLVTNRCMRMGMTYTEIKQKALHEAERLHDEWLVEHLSGNPHSEGDELGEEVATDRLRKRLILGELAADDLEDAIAFLRFVEMKRRTQDEWRDPKLLLKSISTQPLINTVPTPQSEHVSFYVEDYFSDMKEGKDSLTDATMEKYRVSVNDFIEIIGDKSVMDVDHKDGRYFREKLHCLPTHRTKTYKDKTASELFALKLPRDECLSKDTIKHRLNHVRRYLEWLVVRKFATDNPLKGVSVVSENKSYPAYTDDDLARLFKSPIYDIQHPKCRGIGTQSRWWLLLLATFTGARIGELCQLRITDVVSSDGLLCLSINDDDFKTLKTGAAKRLIPVHPALLELGFSEYITALKGREEDRLLPSIPAPTNAKKAGAAASDWYGQKYHPVYLKSFKKEGKVFHSFRHTFIQSAMSANAEMSKLQQMVGHESKEMGATMIYAGEGWRASLLMEQLKKVQFPSIDINWLQQNHWSGLKKP